MTCVRKYFNSGIFLGLAILTKGPVALLICFLALIVRIILGWRPDWLQIKGLFILMATATLVGGSWFLVLFLNGQGQLIFDFINYQIRLFSTPDAGHGGIFFYHPIVLLFGCFPAAIPAAGALFTINPRPHHFTKWMKILFWVTLILFSVVTTKIVHYSSLCYFPLTYLGADYLLHREWNKTLSYLLLIIGAIIGLLLTVLPLVFAIAHTVNLGYLIKDSFVVGILSVDVWWTGLECLTGIVLLISLEIGYRDISQARVRQGMAKVMIGTFITVLLCLITIVPNVEWHVQRSAINFFKNHGHEEVYIRTLGFKSYADLYYSNASPFSNYRTWSSEWYLHGEIDKPVYFVCKASFKNKVSRLYPHLKFVGAEGGFEFYSRPVPKPTSYIGPISGELKNIELRQPQPPSRK